MVVFKKKGGGGGGETTEWDIFKFLNLHFFVGDRNKKSSEIAEFQRISRVKSSFEWCHQESNRGHKDFQSFALPTELWHHCFSFAVAKVGIFFESTIFLQIFCQILFGFKKMIYLCTRKTETECSAVGSALRSGRRGRAFESPHSDRERQAVKIACRFFYLRKPL